MLDKLLLGGRQDNTFSSLVVVDHHIVIALHDLIHQRLVLHKLPEAFLSLRLVLSQVEVDMGEFVHIELILIPDLAVYKDGAGYRVAKTVASQNIVEVLYDKGAHRRTIHIRKDVLKGVVHRIHLVHISRAVQVDGTPSVEVVVHLILRDVGSSLTVSIISPDLVPELLKGQSLGNILVNVIDIGGPVLSLVRFISNFLPCLGKEITNAGVHTDCLICSSLTASLEVLTSLLILLLRLAIEVLRLRVGKLGKLIHLFIEESLIVYGKVPILLKPLDHLISDLLYPLLGSRWEIPFLIGLIDSLHLRAHLSLLALKIHGLALDGSGSFLGCIGNSFTSFPKKLTCFLFTFKELLLSFLYIRIILIICIFIRILILILICILIIL